MSDNTLTEDGSQSLAAALPDLQNLRVINLGDCLVRSEGGLVIAEAFKNGHCQLEVRESGGREIGCEREGGGRETERGREGERREGEREGGRKGGGWERRRKVLLM